MIKIELIEKCHSKNPQVLPQIIEGHCGTVYNQLLFDTGMGSDYDIHAKQYLNVPVLYDEAVNQFYCEYPQDICVLPDGAGVRRINRMKGQGREFVPIQKSAIPAFNNLVVSKTDKTIGYSLTQERIELERNPGVKELKMSLVIPFERFDYEDQVHIPKGQDAKFWAAVDQLINGTPPVNKVNE